MKKDITKPCLNLTTPIALIALSAQLSAVTFDNGDGDNFWGNDANWNAAHPDGVDTAATIQKTTTVPANRIVLLANSAGVDTSYTVKNFTFGTGSGGGFTSSPYAVNNVSGGSAKLIFEASSGDARLTFKNMYATVTMEVNAGITLNSNLDIDVQRTSGTFRINGDIGGSNGINKIGAGTLLLNGVGSYTGATTLENGTLLLGAADRIADTSNFVFDGGTLATNGFAEAMGTLLLTDTSFIDLGAGDSDISFLDSSALSWTAATVLNISNFDEGVDSVRFGTDASGLTGTQLSQITLNGGSAYIDASGYLTAVPEVGSFALLGGLVALSYIAVRRRT